MADDPTINELVSFPIDSLEAMRYVMPYLDVPRKAHDLKVFQETLKPIKALPKKMI